MTQRLIALTRTGFEPECAQELEVGSNSLHVAVPVMRILMTAASSNCDVHQPPQRKLRVQN